MLNSHIYTYKSKGLSRVIESLILFSIARELVKESAIKWWSGLRCTICILKDCFMAQNFKCNYINYSLKYGES